MEFVINKNIFKVIKNCLFFSLMFVSCTGSSVYHEIELQEGLNYIGIPSANGYMISLSLNKPNTEGPYPTLIGIAGGDGMFAFQDLYNLRNNALEAGILLVDFAPQGRSSSEGEDNHHGYVHQDDLKAIVDFLSVQPFVDKSNIGIISFSFGVAVATGALSRYPEIPVQFLIDWEGPAAPGRDIRRGMENNESWIEDPVLDRVMQGNIIHGGDIYDDAYWDERDASIFAAELPCPYLRIQFEKDHVQGYSKYHMMKIINAATEFSGQWTRCNDNPPDIIYTVENIGNYHFTDTSLYLQEGMEIIMGCIKEMFFEKPWLNN